MEIWFTLGDDLRHAFLAVVLIRAENFPPNIFHPHTFVLPCFCNRVNIICSLSMSTIRAPKKRAAPSKVTKEAVLKRPKTTPEATAPTGPPHTPSKTIIRFSGPPPTRVCNRSARARSTPLDRADRLNVGPTNDSDRSDRFQVGPC